MYWCIKLQYNAQTYVHTTNHTLSQDVVIVAFDVATTSLAFAEVERGFELEPECLTYC